VILGSGIPKGPFRQPQHVIYGELGASSLCKYAWKEKEYRTSRRVDVFPAPKSHISKMSHFYFDGDSGSISSADDEDNLPYPEALPRSDFLSPNFDAPSYLSSLSNRHQTLEDLRSDLRERSQALSKELLDLVNTNYEHFLSLGSDLKGGEEKVEDVRVGLLGFKRGVEDVRSKVKERGQVVEGLLDQKMIVAKHISVGRKVLEFDARLEELEERLMVASLSRNSNGVGEDSWSDSEDEDEDAEDADEAIGAGLTTKKLQRLAHDFRHVDHLSAAIGIHHPFVIAQEPRMIRVRNTLLLDLSTILKQVHSAGEGSKVRLLKILSVYRDMGEGAEAVKVLKSIKA
jgi:hypothetical protein